jgi:hypothetical protein
MQILLTRSGSFRRAHLYTWNNLEAPYLKHTERENDESSGFEQTVKCLGRNAAMQQGVNCFSGGITFKSKISATGNTELRVRGNENKPNIFHTPICSYHMVFSGYKFLTE